MKRETTLQKEQQARQRMMLLFQVQAGLKTAVEAAAELGVSRQTFHQWEKRGIHALLQAMEEQAPGRPAITADAEKEELAAQNLELRQRLAVSEEIADLRGSLLRQLEEEEAREERARFKKKSGASEPSSNKPNA